MTYNIDSYIVLRPDQIADIDNPGFPWKGRSEEDFVEFVRLSQPFINESLNVKKISGSIMLDNSGYKGTDEVDLDYIWFDISRCVTVRENMPGVYTCASNGRHRLYVAKKYGYKIIACVR